MICLASMREVRQLGLLQATHSVCAQVINDSAMAYVASLLFIETIQVCVHSRKLNRQAMLAPRMLLQESNCTFTDNTLTHFVRFLLQCVLDVLAVPCLCRLEGQAARKQVILEVGGRLVAAPVAAVLALHLCVVVEKHVT
jgi:hypothetical protein